MKKSEEVLNQKKGEMTFEQIGQILALSDAISLIKFTESQKWIECSRTKLEAEYLINNLCNILDNISVERNRMKCNECDWEGEEMDLVLKTYRNGFGDDNMCPKCGTNKGLVNLDYGDTLSRGFNIGHL
jgi:hypothetical protein